MSAEAGKYEQFNDVVDSALSEYNKRLGEFYSLGGFSGFKETPDKPNSARDVIDIYKAGGEMAAAKLFLIVFEPFDGTGDESYLKLDETEFGFSVFDKTASRLPRSKEFIHSEAHLTIGAINPAHTDEPVLFAGNLNVLGPRGGKIEDIFDIGLARPEFVGAVHGLSKNGPKVTLTTGYSSGIHNPNNPGERFGDPHAVTNDWHYITQVAGFIATGKEEAGILSALGAEEPAK